MAYRIIRNQPRQVPDPTRTGNIKPYIQQRIPTLFVHWFNRQMMFVNIALGVDYKGFSGRISFNMRGNVINFVGIRPEETSYTGNIYRWDLCCSRNYPLKV
jgi:hypothetical protein